MKKVISHSKKVKILPVLMILTLLTGNSKAQKLSDAINDAINWVQTPPCGNICFSVANFGFSIQSGVALTTSDGTASLSLQTKSYTMGGITTKVKYLATLSSNNKYHIYNPLTRSFTESDNFTYSAITNNSLVQNVDLLSELFSISYKTSSGTITVALNNSAIVEKSGTSIVTYRITQTVGTKKVTLRITLEYFLAG